ncbi:hypothetical protein [Kitasatospora sp. NPDC098663]|uniref:hypothetical protein n=1 Tax=Kitasatospora sp. NPDC098663 TaxID=3364096 RepID=UPI0038219DF0
MPLPHFEVYVPMRSTEQAGVLGLHVFTGPAARGFRPGWELNWPATTAGRWANLCRSTKPSTFEL